MLRTNFTMDSIQSNLDYYYTADKKVTRALLSATSFYVNSQIYEAPGTVDSSRGDYWTTGIYDVDLM